MRRLVLISALVVLASLSAYYLSPIRPAGDEPKTAVALESRSVTPFPDPAAKTPSIATPAPSAEPSPAPNLRRPGGSPLAAQLNLPSNPPQRDVDVLHSLLREYLHRLHHRQGLPIGDDIDLGRALSGYNPMKLVVLPRSNPSLSADGHLRDRWGTPYFIHAQGGNAFEIRSAGPDRKMFTSDDLIAQPAMDGGEDQSE